MRRTGLSLPSLHRSLQPRFGVCPRHHDLQFFTTRHILVNLPAASTASAHCHFCLAELLKGKKEKTKTKIKTNAADVLRESTDSE